MSFFDALKNDHFPINEPGKLDPIRKSKADLVEATYFNGCCGECAKYRGRWFRIGFKYRQFPKLPTDYNCTCSGLTFSPVLYGISVPVMCSEKKIVEYSNRPFVDDRTPQEKADNANYMKEIENERNFVPYRAAYEKIKQYDQKQYETILKKIPDAAPKSFAGYMRMKQSNSKNYQKLRSLSANVGIDLDYPLDLSAEFNRILPFVEKYKRVKAECAEYYKKKRK